MGASTLIAMTIDKTQERTLIMIFRRCHLVLLLREEICWRLLIIQLLHQLLMRRMESTMLLHPHILNRITLTIGLILHSAIHLKVTETETATPLLIKTGWFPTITDQLFLTTMDPRSTI